MRAIFVFLLLQIGILALAQTRCLMTTHSQTKPATHLPEVNALLKTESSPNNSGLLQDAFEDAVIRVPVVVHVLYNSALENISDAQIRSGIDALNRDFRRKAADTINTPQRFRELAADARIEFALATADPNGRSTAGIIRKQTLRSGWIADDKMKRSAEGGDDGWDSRNYLNIWIVNLIGVSGYATMPGSDENVDGVVICYKSFGTINTLAPYNMGRTDVHEVGHWLGLKHIWGDAPCGDDGIDDTPTQSFFTKGCPTNFRSSCNNGETGDMYMNFMDYTDDVCMNLFTKGQCSRMRLQFAEGEPRESILQSKGLLPPWVSETPLPVANASLYPNPANNKITVQVNASFIGKKLTLFNSQGQLQKTEVINSLQQDISVSELKPGVYLLKGDGFLQKFVKL